MPSVVVLAEAVVVEVDEDSMTVLRVAALLSLEHCKHAREYQLSSLLSAHRYRRSVSLFPPVQLLIVCQPRA